MKRIFERRESQRERYEKVKRIAFVGAGHDSGCSFVATSLAHYLAKDLDKQVTYIQLDRNTSIYDALGFDKRFIGRTFEDYREAAKNGKKLASIRNIDERVNWLVNTPHKENINSDKALNFKLFTFSDGDVIIYDFGSDFDSERDNSGAVADNFDMLSEMDVVFFVVDPLPSKLLAGRQIFKEIYSLEQGVSGPGMRSISGLSMQGAAGAYGNQNANIITVINHANPGINRRELSGFLGMRTVVEVPQIDPELIYLSEYNCELPVTRKDVKENLIESLVKMSRYIT